LYAHYLSPAEFGMLEIFYVTAALFQTVLASGVAHAALRYYFEFDDPADRGSAIVSALAGTLALSVLGVAALLPFAPFFSGWLFGSPGETLAFRLAFSAIVFEISKEVSLAWLRAADRPGLYVTASVFQLVGQVAANVYTVVVLELGVRGVLLGNLAVSAFVWAILTGMTLRGCGFRVRWSLLRAIFAYGSPVMLSGLVSAGVRSFDRYLLNALTTLTSIGHYALGLRIGTVAETFVNDPFYKSYGPHRFAIMKQEGAEATYARVLTYYAAAAVFVTLSIAVFSKELVELIAAPEYLDAYRIVPLVLLSFPLRGMAYCLQTAIYIHKRSRLILYSSLVSGAANVAGNLILVPRFGIHGAAASQAVAAAVAVAVTYGFAQRLQRIPYEVSRVAKLALAGVALGVAVSFIDHSGVVALAAKAAVVALFPALLLLLRVPNAEERAALRSLWRPRAERPE
jgi:O-antigen/teichoic acid export membrane protein